MSEDSAEVLLARIDENVKFLKSGAEAVRIQLHEHEKDDNDKFKNINKKVDSIRTTVLMASGGLAVIVFLLGFIKH